MVYAQALEEVAERLHVTPMEVIGHEARCKDVPQQRDQRHLLAPATFVLVIQITVQYCEMSRLSMDDVSCTLVAA